METKRSKGKPFIIAAILLAAGLGAAFIFFNSGETVSVEKARIGTLTQIVSDNGIIESEGTTTLAAKSTMEITRLYVKEGDFVKAGDVILSNNDKTASLDISSLKAQAAGIAAQASNANKVAANAKALYDAGAISQSEYNAARATASQLNAQLSSLNYSIESFKQGTGIGGLTSTVSGYVTELYAKEGETIPAGGNVVEISPLKNFTVVLNLIPEDAVKVSVGDTATIKQDDVVLTDACKVERISKKAKEVLSDIGIGQKRVEIILDIPETTQGLILGNSVDVEIITETLENKLMVSSESIFEKEDLKYVYVVIEGKAKMKKVKTGLEGDKTTEIISGLTEGDQVILSPGNNVTDGVKIKK